MFFQTAFNKNEHQAMTEYCSVVKVVELSENDFNLLKNNTMENMSFIAEHAELMHKDETGTNRCVLYLRERYDEGIIVNSEGTNYAKNFSYLPQARTLCLADESFTLQQFVKSMLNIRNDIVDKAIKDQEDGVFKINLGEIHKFYKPKILSPNLLYEILNDRIEFTTIEFDDDEFSMRLSEEFAVFEEDTPYRELEKEDIDVMVAKHILWLYDEPGGEQADFSGCFISNYDFSDRSLNSAIMNNAKFVNCNFMNTELCFANAEYSKFVDCSMIRMTAEEMHCKGTKFKGCNLFQVMMTHSNFTDALFSRCTVGSASMTNSCIENTKWIHTACEDIILNNYCEDEQEWLDESENESMGMNLC